MGENGRFLLSLLNSLLLLYCFVSVLVLRYYVATYTANTRNASTSGEVFVTLIGQLGDSGRRKLGASRTHQTRFGQGQIDVFSMEAVSVGSLQRVVVEVEGDMKR